MQYCSENVFPVIVENEALLIKKCTAMRLQIMRSQLCKIDTQIISMISIPKDIFIIVDDIRKKYANQHSESQNIDIFDEIEKSIECAQLFLQQVRKSACRVRSLINTIV